MPDLLHHTDQVIARLSEALNEGWRFADEQKSTLILLDKSSPNVDGRSLNRG